jgi:hypothetical protein
MVGAKDRSADLRASLAPCHDEYAVAFIQQSTSLCQATLSIGPYLLLEGACRREDNTRWHEP